MEEEEVQGLGSPTRWSVRGEIDGGEEQETAAWQRPMRRTMLRVCRPDWYSVRSARRRWRSKYKRSVRGSAVGRSRREQRENGC